MKKQIIVFMIIYIAAGILLLALPDVLFSDSFRNENQLVVFRKVADGVFIAISLLVLYFLTSRKVPEKSRLMDSVSEPVRWSDLVVSNLPDTSVFLLDTDLNHIAAHGKDLKDFGYFSDTVLNKPLYEIGLEPVFHQFLKKNYSMILDGENVVTEINLNNSWFEFRGSQIKDENTGNILILAIFNNITEKKQWINHLQLQKIEIEDINEQNEKITSELTNRIKTLSEVNYKLLESEQRYRMFFDNINDAAYIHEVVDGKEPGRFLDVNQKMVEYLGYSRGELLEMHPNQIASQDSLEKFKSSTNFFENMSHQYIEMEHLTKTGKKIPVELSMHYFQDEGKHMVFGTVRDIRERVKYIRKLKKAKEKAEESDQLKSAFLANISHEVRTPMNGIIGFTDLISQVDLSEEQKDTYIRLIKRSADQLLRIINELLDISKIDTGQLKLNKNNMSLNELMDELMGYMKSLLNQNSKNLTISCVRSLQSGDDVILADGKRLRQIFQNLLNNAEKFTESGNIEFGYNVSDEENIRFFVRDTGIGISSDKVLAVFERFRQADDSHTREFGGIGLGLPIAKGLVELMGGTVNLETETDKGTMVEFILPVQKSKLAKREPSIPLVFEEPDLTNKTLLIVEDNPENSALLSEYAQLNGAQVIVTAKGREAIDLCMMNPNIDLIFMDIRLPDISGLEVTKSIKKFLSNVPIIAQTAYASSEDMNLCLEAGCDDFITKPIEMKAFYSMVSKHIH